jgi:hypothetical protein
LSGLEEGEVEAFAGEGHTERVAEVGGTAVDGEAEAIELVSVELSGEVGEAELCEGGQGAGVEATATDLGAREGGAVEEEHGAAGAGEGDGGGGTGRSGPRDEDIVMGEEGLSRAEGNGRGWVCGSSHGVPTRR